ncbi:hypothetical protein NDU88_010474 [Pleurodeles waltl]|uniref:Uncharacterized protein n=1 Tax=Pleurodeles waltl TaxID=8319 RepID=A0AAV7S3E1_PLEWA|nr:hypothetical protein NDU88_010474 [Pleurodeles waltl]
MSEDREAERVELNRRNRESKEGGRAQMPMPVRQQARRVACGCCVWAFRFGEGWRSESERYTQQPRQFWQAFINLYLTNKARFKKHEVTNVTILATSYDEPTEEKVCAVPKQCRGKSVSPDTEQRN